MSRSAPMLASLYDVPVTQRKTAPLAELMNIAAERATAEATPQPNQAKRRNHIWELNTSLHCSIIGTCLTPAELRRLLIRLNIADADTAGDHDLHMLGVLLAARPKEGAKILEKALDRRHRGALNRFAKAQGPEALCALWEGAMAGGDIPGAYWALLTHPLSTNDVVRHAFGDVHMLSHLVGATNRADLVRLRQLEAENAALADKIERQQNQLRDGFVARDATIRRLEEALAGGARKVDQSPERGTDARALRETVTCLSARLAQESERRLRIEQRLGDMSAAREAAVDAQRLAVKERNALHEECASLEGHIEALLASEARDGADTLDLAGMTILYVGGRANQVPKFKVLVERSAGKFLHHDGGVEHSAALLPGFVSRADVSLFPVDCVSHDAVAAIKRVCRQIARPYRRLRTSSLACLLTALAGIRRSVGREAVE